MAVSAGVAIGTGIVAGAGATAAAIRAAKQRTKPNQTPYGAAENVMGVKDPNAGQQYYKNQEARAKQYQANVANLGPRPTKEDPLLNQARWDKQKAILDAALKAGEKYDLATAKDGTQEVVQKSGYEVATEPLLDMQQQGAAAYAQGQQGLIGASQAAEQQRLLGLGLNSTAAQDQATSAVNQQAVTNAGADYINAYQPGAVSQAMSRQVLDQNAQANLGAARASGALGLRNALNANAFTGVQAAGQMATQAAQEQERYLAAQVGQANEDRAAILGQRNLEQQLRIKAEEDQRARVLQQQALGLGVAQQSLGTGLQASTTFGNQAIQREQTAAAGLDSIRQSQLEADLNYDTRRQQEGQRRSDRLWGLAGGLVGVAGGALGRLGGK